MAFVYILYSEKIDSYYVGATNDMTDRIGRHNSGRSQYTKRGIPWTLVYSKEYPSKSEAFKVERHIKSQKSRKYLEDLIKGDVQLA